MFEVQSQTRLRRRIWRIIISAAGAALVLAALPATAARAASYQGTPSPSSVDFGAVWVGQVGTRVVRLTNTGTRNLSVGAVGVAVFTPNLFVLDSTTCQGVTLRPGRSCTATVSFTPFRWGVYDAQLFFDATNTPAVNLRGTAIQAGPAAGWASPPALDFGTVQGGRSVTKTVTLTNVGGEYLYVAINELGEDPNDFTTNKGCQGAYLAPGKSCKATVTYAPVAGWDSGDQTANLWFLDANYGVYGWVQIHGFAA